MLFSIVLNQENDSKYKTFGINFSRNLLLKSTPQCSPPGFLFLVPSLAESLATMHACHDCHLVLRFEFWMQCAHTQTLIWPEAMACVGLIFGLKNYVKFIAWNFGSSYIFHFYLLQLSNNHLFLSLSFLSSYLFIFYLILIFFRFYII